MEQEIETKQEKQEVEKTISPRELRFWGAIAFLVVFLTALQIWTRPAPADCAPANITVN